MDVKRVREVTNEIISNVSKVIIGKQKQIKLILSAMYSKGHVLIEDIPGVGKTMLARAIAKSISGVFKRVQATPDLLPSDIIGVSIYNPETKKFEFRKGPIISNILLVDEINRATPKTQSALLEAMGETQISVEGISINLPNPFIVLATQNPIEFEGTFPLPEAQMDRFMINISLGYPSQDEEVEILTSQKQIHPIETISSVCTTQEVVEIQEEIKKVYIEESLKRYIVEIVNKTRGNPNLLLGASPRGSLAIFKMAQSLAGINGRDYVIPEDIKSVVMPCLRHRLILKPEAKLKGIKPEDILNSILETTEVPVEEVKKN
ncbi:MAG: MoxR family ATPase [Spirochaetia bacterium]|nr:MoxR family ATPase [Spirochaetota bacterium]MCX8096624.1 MoxR family ATPase [Spirochaetota bacterium]MDW8112071.1 MoxR family ATPase [Spirochaetia bacterium]